MQYHEVMLTGGPILRLPIVDIGLGEAIALLMCNDISYKEMDSLINSMAKLVRPFDPDILVGIPEQGIPLVHGVGRALGHARSYLLRKTPKAFDINFLRTPYYSITKPNVTQYLHLSHANAGMLEGKKVAVIEDVINTGSTVQATLRLLRLVPEVEIVGVFVVLTEGRDWGERLLFDSRLVHSLGHIPVFRPAVYEPINEVVR